MKYAYESLMKEWKTYQVENRTFSISNEGEILNERGKKMKTMLHKQGYPCLPLNIEQPDGKIKSYKILVQRMVALSFIPNPDNKPFVIQRVAIKDKLTSWRS